MKSIWLLSVKLFQRRVNQFLSIGITLFLTSLILGMALSLIRMLDHPFDSVFDQLKASHLLLFFDNRMENHHQLAQWFSEQGEVAEIGDPSVYYSLTKPALHQGREVDLMLQITEHTTGHLQLDRVLVVKGDQKGHPQYGEIWLPYHLETNQGMQLGDTVRIYLHGRLYELQISAFVLDPHYQSAIFNPTRAWVAPGTLSLFLPVSDLNTNTMGIRLKDESELDNVWARFNKAFAYSGSSLQYPLFKRAFTSVYQMLSAVLLIFSGMALVISLLLINHAITSHIAADIKLIGMLKSLGFTPGKLNALYLLQLGLLVLVAVPLGSLVALYGVDLIANLAIHEIYLDRFAANTSIPVVVSAIMVIAVALIISLISSQKAGLVVPVEAMRNSAILEDKKIVPWSEKLMSTPLPLPALLGLKFLSSHPKNLLRQGINLVGVVFITVFCINIAASFANIGSNRSAWGFDNADLQLIRNESIVLPLEHAQLMEMLASYDGKITNISAYGYADLRILADSLQATQEVMGKVYFTPLPETGLENIQGRHPESAQEISLCIGTSRQVHKSPGDSIPCLIEGQTKTFIVTGIYQDVSNLGQGFRLHHSAMELLNPLFEPYHYGLVLPPSVDPDKFKSQLQAEFGETIQTELSIEDRKSIMAMVTNIKVAVTTISLFFVVVLVLLIYNDLTIHIYQNRLEFAKLKVLGFTAPEIRSILAYKVVAYVALGIIIGIPLSIWLGTKIMNMLTAGIGLVQFPMVISLAGTTAAIAGLLALGVLTAWFTSSKITSLDTRMLSSGF